MLNNRADYAFGSGTVGSFMLNVMTLTFDLFDTHLESLA